MDLWEIALGFMDARILLTADELGLFDHLAGGPRTAAEVAAAVDLPEDSALRLLTALCAMGVVRRLPDGRFVNGPEAEAQLVRGRPGYIGAMFQHVRDDLYPVWAHLKEALREGSAQWERAFPGRPSPTEALYSDPRALRAFMDGMHAITERAARELAAGAPELGALGHVVDLGGASGAFLIALAERFPSLRGTVVDLPKVAPIAEERIARHGLSDRLRFHAADFFRDPLPQGADAYALGFVLHDWDTESGSRLLARIAEAIRPGGTLIVGEYLLNEDRSGPRHVARMDLNMLVAARGRERTASEYGAWLRAFGFELRRILPTSHGKTFLIARR